jgi:hypothetical protein
VTPTAAMRAWRVWLLLQPLGRRPGLPVAGTDRPARGHAGGGCETATRARWRVWTVARRVAAWRCTPALGCRASAPAGRHGNGDVAGTTATSGERRRTASASASIGIRMCNNFAGMGRRRRPSPPCSAAAHLALVAGGRRSAARRISSRTVRRRRPGKGGTDTAAGRHIGR